MIRPKFHNFLNISDDSSFINNNWSSYCAINQKIAQKVIEVRSQIKDLKTVWVHGDHLMLVPQYVRKSFSQANLGYYFHSAFPASAVFSSLYYRRELLQSLLQTDCLGFHLFEYARNFLNTCHRLFGLNLDYSNGGFLSVNYHGKIVGVRVSHIGIDEDFVQHIMKQSAFKK
jgi:trehalose 6-phosphate synthase/phosphatase